MRISRKAKIFILTLFVAAVSAAAVLFLKGGEINVPPFKIFNGCENIYEADISFEKKDYYLGEKILANIFFVKSGNEAVYLNLKINIYQNENIFVSKEIKNFAIDEKVKSKKIEEIFGSDFILPVEEKYKGVWKMELLAKNENCDLKSEAEFTVNEKTKEAGGFIQTEVWTGDDGAHTLRDPVVYKNNNESFIISALGYIAEFKDVYNMTPYTGKGYKLNLYDSSGEKIINKKNDPWGMNFYNWDGKIYMYVSFQPPPDYDFSLPPSKANSFRRIYAMVPKENSKYTKGGFPLDWKLNSSRPLFFDGDFSNYTKDAYDGRIFTHEDAVYLLNDHTKANTAKAAVCMYSRKMLGPVKVDSEEYELVCPGKWNAGLNKWNTESPYPSEVRFGDGGGLVEGAWGYYDFGAKKIYLFYSSGAYESKDNYGGFLAVCENLTSHCEKVLTKDEREIKQLTPAAGKGFFMMGRPYPLIIGQKLYDILFHGRSELNYNDTVLRCSNFPPLSDNFLRDFENGNNNGCEIGPRGDYCGNGTCAAGENTGNCLEDCGDCFNSVPVSIKTSKSVYNLGDSIKGNIFVKNNSKQIFTAGVSASLYHGENLIWESPPTALSVMEGNMDFDLSLVFNVIPPVIPYDRNLLGEWKMKIKMKAGKCGLQTVAETKFRVE